MGPSLGPRLGRGERLPTSAFHSAPAEWLQVCVAHGVMAWELGRATSRDLGTENRLRILNEGRLGLKVPHELGDCSFVE